MLNTAGVAAADVLEESGQALGLGSGEVEGVAAVEQRASLVSDGPACAEQPERERTMSIISPGIERLLVQEDQIVNGVSEFAREAEEAGCGVLWAADTSLAERFSQRLVGVACTWQTWRLPLMTGRHRGLPGRPLLDEPSLCVDQCCRRSQRVFCHRLRAKLDSSKWFV